MVMHGVFASMRIRNEVRANVCMIFSTISNFELRIRFALYDL